MIYKIYTLIDAIFSKVVYTYVTEVIVLVGIEKNISNASYR